MPIQNRWILCIPLLVAASFGCRAKPKTESEEKTRAVVKGLPPDPSNLETPGPSPADAIVKRAEVPETFQVRFETTQGNFTVQVHRKWAPHGAKRIYELAKSGFFDGCQFFRVVSGFMAQWGIHGHPETQAKWREMVMPDDPPDPKISNTAGRLTFATAGENTRTTQVFINYADNSRLDKLGFTPVGEVIDGMNVVKSLYSGYGDGPPDGKGPNQSKIQAYGNSYLKTEYPKLDSIKKAVLIVPQKKKSSPKKTTESKKTKTAKTPAKTEG